MMRRVELESHLWLYQIPAIDEDRLGQNIVVLVEGRKALFVDAGYERECQEVLDDLASRHIKVVEVLPTHFHPDHVQGLWLMDHPKVYGHPLAKKTLKRFYEEDEMLDLLPRQTLSDGEIIKFGHHTLECHYAPGHSDCSLILLINNQYVHFGDLYMKMDDGREVLPYVSWDGVKDHMMSLSKMSAYSDKCMLISHGLCPVEKEDFEVGLKDREIYLQALIDSNNVIAADEATDRCQRPFEMIKWRGSVT